MDGLSEEREDCFSTLRVITTPIGRTPSDAMGLYHADRPTVLFEWFHDLRVGEERLAKPSGLANEMVRRTISSDERREPTASGRRADSEQGA